MPGLPRHDGFSIPQDGRPAASPRRPAAVRDGARWRVFLLPGIRALRYIAGASRSGRSGRGRPAPEASGLLLALHRTLVAGLHVERRFEPFFRRGLNRLLREPVAAFLQYLINLNARTKA